MDLIINRRAHVVVLGAALGTVGTAAVEAALFLVAFGLGTVGTATISVPLVVSMATEGGATIATAGPTAFVLPLVGGALGALMAAVRHRVTAARRPPTAG